MCLFARPPVRRKIVKILPGREKSSGASAGSKFEVSLSDASKLHMGVTARTSGSTGVMHVFMSGLRTTTCVSILQNTQGLQQVDHCVSCMGLYHVRQIEAHELPLRSHTRTGRTTGMPRARLVSSSWFFTRSVST